MVLVLVVLAVVIVLGLRDRNPCTGPVLLRHGNVVSPKGCPG